MVLAFFIQKDMMVKIMMPFGKTSDFNWVTRKLVMTEMWKKHHKIAKSYDE